MKSSCDSNIHLKIHINGDSWFWPWLDVSNFFVGQCLILSLWRSPPDSCCYSTRFGFASNSGCFVCGCSNQPIY